MHNKSYIEVSEALLVFSKILFQDQKDRYRFLAFCALLQSKGRDGQEIELYSKYLKDIYTHYKKKTDRARCRYKYYINVLLQNGYLTKTHNHSTFKNKCNTYKLSESLVESAMYQIGIAPEKDQRFWEKYFKVAKEMTEFERKAADHIKSHTILNTNEAFDIFMKKQYPSIYNQIDRTYPDIKKTEELIREECRSISKIKKERKAKRKKRLSKEIRKFRNGIRSLNQMDSNDCRVKIDSFGKRLHSPLTRMNKIIRNQLRTPAGEPFFQIDAKNCQPFLIGFILISHGYKIDEDFIKNTTNGSFNNSFVPEVDICKERAKTAIISNVLYAKDNKLRFITKAGKTFRELYPKTFFAILDFTKKDKKRLCREAQRLESEIFVKRVYGQILERNIPAFSIHDCIATTREYVEIVVEMIQNAFISLCGISPKLDLK